MSGSLRSIEMFIGINSAQSDPVLVVSFDGLTLSYIICKILAEFV